MLRVRERAPTDAERAELDSLGRPFGPGPVETVAVVVALSILIGLIGSPLLGRVTTLDAGTRGVITIGGSVVVLGGLACVPAVRRSPARVLAKRRSPPPRRLTEIEYTADAAWPYAGGDDDAPALLFRVDQDTFVAINDACLEDAIENEPERVAPTWRAVWSEADWVLMEAEHSGPPLRVGPWLPEHASLIGLPALAVLRAHELPPEVRDLVRR